MHLRRGRHVQAAWGYATNSHDIFNVVRVSSARLRPRPRTRSRSLNLLTSVCRVAPRVADQQLGDRV